MASEFFKSNNAVVIAGQRPAFSDDDRNGSSMSGAYMSTVQNISIGFTQQREKSKQLGSKDLVYNDLTRMPDVDLAISYYYSPTMLNENLLGLCDANPSYQGTGFFQGYTDEDQNFYIINSNDQGFDLINNNESLISSYPDAEVFAIGNAFLTSYSIGFSVGSPPIVSTSYKCSNISMQNGVELDETINPAINLQSGNTDNAGTVTLEDAKVSGFDYYSDVNRLHAPLCSPTDVNVTLENLQAGGVPISGDTLLQSFSFNIPINRVDLFGLGSDYPYGRKVEYPITASVDLQFIVSGFNTGEMTSYLINESSYDFDIQIVDTGNIYQNTFSFENLRLENSSYELNVNDQMIYSLGFSFEITN